MGTLLEDGRIASEWMRDGLVKSGYKADFRPESLYEIERFLSEHSADGRPNPRGLLAEEDSIVAYGVGLGVLPAKR